MHSKDNEILESREKAKTDFEKKLRAIHKDIELNDEYRDRIKQLENDLKGIWTLSPHTWSFFDCRSTLHRSTNHSWTGRSCCWAASDIESTRARSHSFETWRGATAAILTFRNRGIYWTWNETSRMISNSSRAFCHFRMLCMDRFLKSIED